MTCQNCKSPDCTLLAATQREHAAWRVLCNAETAATWKRASEALEQAQSDCAHRAAYPKTDLSARLDRIEARQDRIEAMLRDKGWMS
jgi:hypothetical protein